AFDFLTKLFAQRRREALAHSGDLPAHFVLRLLALGRQDEEPDCRQDRREDESGHVRGGCRCRDGDDRTKAERAGANGRGSSDGISRTIRQLLRFAPAIVGVDDSLRLAPPSLREPRPIVVEAPAAARIVSDNAAAILAPTLK